MPQLTSADGLTLYYEVNAPSDPKAVVVLVHGFGDHCGRYQALTETLVSWGITCYRFDYRGHGRSEGKRGHAERFSLFLDDLHAVASLAAEDAPTLPHLLLAHSHGGLMALHYLAGERQPCAWSGAVLSSPFFGISLPIPAWKSAAGKLMSKLMPTFQLPTEIDGANVSHDPEVVKGYDTDPLVGHVASARWFTEVTQAHAESPTLAERVTLPLMIQAAGTDHLVSLDATRAVFARVRSTSKEMKVYDELYHELWFERPDLRELVIDDLKAWLDQWLSMPES